MIQNSHVPYTYRQNTLPYINKNLNAFRTHQENVRIVLRVS